MASSLDSFFEASKRPFSKHLSLIFCPHSAVLVLFLEFVFRLQPVVELAAVNCATLDVDLEGSLTDFGWCRSTFLFFDSDVRLKYDLRHALCICECASRFHDFCLSS